MSLAMAELFKRISCGVYVVGVAANDRRNAFTAAWVMPISFRPLMLTLGVNPAHFSYGLLLAGRGFSINVLGREQIGVAAHFGQGAGIDKLATAAWFPGRTGLPLLTDAVAQFECELWSVQLCGDHALVTGRVIDWALLRPEAEVLSYDQTGDMDGASAIYPDDFA
jgi:flavin reductase (DIM6/NTAB) family NADH-FMN oxidoreductase RutF